MDSEDFAPNCHMFPLDKTDTHEHAGRYGYMQPYIGCSNVVPYFDTPPYSTSSIFVDSSETILEKHVFNEDEYSRENRHLQDITRIPYYLGHADEPAMSLASAYNHDDVFGSPNNGGAFRFPANSLRQYSHVATSCDQEGYFAPYVPSVMRGFSCLSPLPTLSQLLKLYNVHAKKQLGQNFLLASSITGRSVTQRCCFMSRGTASHRPPNIGSFKRAAASAMGVGMDDCLVDLYIVFRSVFLVYRRSADGFDHIHAVYNPSEDGVLGVQMGLGTECYEELTLVCVLDPSLPC
ncbi:unnamed protein product [Sphagnum compactum]